MIVIDASLATKWFLAEVDSDRAHALLKRSEAELCGPDVLALEVCRALVAATNARRISDVAARAAIDLWLDRLEGGSLSLRATDWRLLRSATALAIDLGHPLADCLYLALAIALDCDLATCDVRFRDKAIGRYPRVRLLIEIT